MPTNLALNNYRQKNQKFQTAWATPDIDIYTHERDRKDRENKAVNILVISLIVINIQQLFFSPLPPATLGVRKLSQTSKSVGCVLTKPENVDVAALDCHSRLQTSVLKKYQVQLKWRFKV